LPKENDKLLISPDTFNIAALGDGHGSATHQHLLKALDLILSPLGLLISCSYGDRVA